jgi:L-threonylcarbamoyladenylate synthase
MSTELIEILKNNGLAIVTTDTLYGVLGNARSEQVVQRIYDLKGRDENKPFIVLIPSIESLQHFGIALSDFEREKVSQWWPGPVTVILPLPENYQKHFSYLHRGTNELAFRIPAKESLLELLKQTGPLVAPSANPQGKEPANTIEEARAYFGNGIDVYEDAGRVEGLPSTIVRLKDSQIKVIRQGAVSVV